MNNNKTVKFLPAFAVLLLVPITLFSFLAITRSLRHDECCSVEVANTTWARINENVIVHAHEAAVETCRWYFIL